jgi:hypothetical protein
MLTTVVFFLLLTSSMIQYVKLSVPPATVREEALKNKVELAPRMHASRVGGKVNLELLWNGAEPGSLKALAAQSGAPGRDVLVSQAKALSAQFKTRYPDERTLRLALGPELTVQDLISVMDGARENFPTVTLQTWKNIARGTP